MLFKKLFHIIIPNTYNYVYNFVTS